MRVAVITGASSGIGRELALKIDEKIPGIEEFWLFARREEKLKDCARLLTKPCRIFPWDMEEQGLSGRLEELYRREKPEIVFLVLAAGFGKLGSVEALPLEEQISMIDVNVRALTIFSGLSIPYMAKCSRMILFASAASFLPQPEFSVYAATKAYVLSFSRALHEELGDRGCSVLAVCPGPVKTEFFRIAEEHGTTMKWKKFFMADAGKVAELALFDSVLKKQLSVYHPLMKLFHVLAKLLPHSLLLSALSGLLKKAGPEEGSVSGGKNIHSADSITGIALQNTQEKRDESSANRRK